MKRRRYLLLLLLLPILLLILMALNADKLIQSEQPQPGADVIFVLGSPAAADGSPGDVMRTRVEKGVELYKAGYAPRLVFQGGAVSNEHGEAQVMARLARELGVGDEAIYLEENSQDTVQNVEEALRLIRENDWSDVIVVTSKYHSRRVEELFAAHDTDVTTVVVDYPAHWGPLRRLDAIVHEYALLAWNRLAGHS